MGSDELPPPPDTVLAGPSPDTLAGDAPTMIPDGEALTGVGIVAPPVLDEGFAARYRALAVLGAGGMGEVRLSADAVIGREVAMKVVRAEASADAERQARFVREARIQGQLEHPAVVPVYDLGHDPRGALYFTMKRVRGLSLEQIFEGLRGGDPVLTRQYTRRRLLGAFASVCLGIDFAHSRGVVHRDLKPANVMLGDFGEVYILDWGLARHLRQAPLVRIGADETTGVGMPAGVSESGGAARTAHGVMLGTPGFMAPEQVRGEHDRIDARTDVYALGAILFELLAGEPLNRTASSVGTLAVTLHGVDARVSARAPAADVPPELEAVCVRATRNDPAERFPSARALHDEIERFLDGDRDVARRRELALAHARAAEEEAARALGSSGPPSTAARSQAMREVGRALALDPDNPGALRTMMRLLTEPPREVPAGVEQASLGMEREMQRSTARLATWLYLSILSFVPLAVWMGVRDWTLGAAGMLLFVAAALSARHASRRADGKLPLGLLLVSNLAVASTWRTFGPFMLLPGLAAVNTIGFLLIARRESRRLVVGMALLPIVIPVLLEWSGLIAPSTVFEGGNVTVVPRLLSLPPGPTKALLLFISMAEVIVAAVLVGRVRDAQQALELRLQTTLWQLRQLVPEDKGAPAAEK